jgi:hypothetical protein
VLYRAYALGHSAKVGDHAPELFARERWQVCIARPSRDLTLRLARRMECIACGEPIAPNGTGDHIVARSLWAAPEGAENYLPLCQPHNSSKGRKNLLAWWHGKGLPPAGLVPDPLLQFARVTYAYVARNTLADMDAPADVVEALEALELALLPSVEHVTVLRQAAIDQAAAARKGGA